MRAANRFLVAIGLLLWQGVVWAAEPVAVLTELRLGQGEVQVKFAGEADWMAPQLLLALQPGDQLRAAGDGQAIVVFIGGHGAQTVSPATSPLTIQAPTGETSAENLRGVLASVMQFLLGQRKATTYQPLTVRKTHQPPLILSPRESRLLPGPLTFEWACLLFQEGLYHEARREVLAGIAAAPEEPTLHLLLGRVNERVGLKDLAAEAFAEARVRSTRHP